MTNKPRYRIGQVIYVVASDRAEIKPLQIVEEIVKRTIDGTETSYIGKDVQNKTVMLSSVTGDVFDSIKELQKTLLQRVSAQINTIVAAAKNKADEAFKETIVAPESEQEHDNATNKPELEEDGAYTVTLENGVKAKVRL